MTSAAHRKIKVELQPATASDPTPAPRVMTEAEEWLLDMARRCPFAGAVEELVAGWHREQINAERLDKAEGQGAS